MLQTPVCRRQRGWVFIAPFVPLFTASLPGFRGWLTSGCSIWAPLYFYLVLMPSLSRRNAERGERGPGEGRREPAALSRAQLRAAHPAVPAGHPLACWAAPWSFMALRGEDLPPGTLSVCPGSWHSPAWHRQLLFLRRPGCIPSIVRSISGAK